MSRRLGKFDVVIVGAGAMGLWLALKAAHCGFKVAVIDKEPLLASGPSTRNEGWGHTGAYHAAAIDDRALAITVARRTREGFHQMLGFASEAVEDPELISFALVGEDRVAEVTDRWQEANVPYRLVSLREFRKAEPRLRLKKSTRVFWLDDVSINTRVLYSKLARHARIRGARFFPSCTLTEWDDRVGTLKGPDGSLFNFSAEVLICTSGLGTQTFFGSVFGIDLPMRFFVSHLLDSPRLTRHGWFGVDPGEPTHMPHGDWSIVGLNKDQVAVPAPSFVPREENITDVLAALRKYLPDVDDSAVRGRACVKVDVEPNTYGFSNLNLGCGELLPNVFWLLPGKMTEAPCAADIMVRVLSERLRGAGIEASDVATVRPLTLTAPIEIAPRPIDQYFPTQLRAAS